MSKAASAVTVSRTNYGDPVAHYIRGVYDEYMSRWSHSREVDMDNGEIGDLSKTKKLSPPVDVEEQKSKPDRSPRKDITSPARLALTKEVDVPAAGVVEADRPVRNGQASSSGQDDSTIVVNQSTIQTANRVLDKADEASVPISVDQDFFEDVIEQRQSSESTLSSVDERRYAAPRTDSRCSTCWHDSIPCQHDETSAMTRLEYLRKFHSKQKHKRDNPKRHSTGSQSNHVQRGQQHQQQRGSRMRDRQHKVRGAETSIDIPTKGKNRPTKRQRAEIEAEIEVVAQESESSEEEVIQWSPRRKLPGPIVMKPAKSFSMGPEEIAALTSTPTLTPATLRRNTAVPRTLIADPEAEEQARLRRKEEREAIERAIVEQQAAEMRAKEADIRKCYYCWHYSQPCNLKMKPKCIPCHKNRRSCFGGYTRPEFCDAYKERTGKVHKQAEKDNVKVRQPIKRKGHYNGGRKASVSANPQPQRFFLNDNKLKCYRCWDRNLSCDLDTPKCASCVKGRAACFGFKSSRQEFCEMFEEETGEKHRWAAFFESGGVQTTPPPSATSPKRRSRPRPTVYEDATSESSGEDGWNSESNESDDDHDENMDNDSDDN